MANTTWVKQSQPDLEAASLGHPGKSDEGGHDRRWKGYEVLSDHWDKTGQKSHDVGLSSEGVECGEHGGTRVESHTPSLVSWSPEPWRTAILGRACLKDKTKLPCSEQAQVVSLTHL